MKEFKIPVETIISRLLTGHSLDIIKECCPEVEIAVADPRKKFRRRSADDDRNPSAQLLLPTAEHPYYSIIDYGDGAKPMSAIDVYMHSKGYAQSDFMRALKELCQKYGVDTDGEVCAVGPRYEQREVAEGEHVGDTLFIKREGFTSDELNCWLKGMKSEVLEAFGWSPVESIAHVKENKVHVFHSTDFYPQFVQECPYTTADGKEKTFCKLYQPMAKDGAFRFQFVGTPPKDYIYGLEALRKAFVRNKEEKFNRVIIASGGSDAAALSLMGEQVVWLGSETSTLTQEMYRHLLRYAKSVTVLFDCDATGEQRARDIAQQFLSIRVAHLPKDVLSRHLDRHGKPCKDVRDLLRLYPDGRLLKKVLWNAHQLRFWDEVKNNENKVLDYSISLERLLAMLNTYGYWRLRDEYSKQVRLVRVKGCCVEEVSLEDINQFIHLWMQDHMCTENLINKVLRGRDLNTNILHHMKDISPDFTSGGNGWQMMYMKNCCVRITPDGIRRISYADMTDCRQYVWKQDILPYNYSKTIPMFTMNVEDGEVTQLDILSYASPVLCFLINSSRLYWREEMEAAFQTAEERKAYAESHRFCLDGEGLTAEQIQEQKQCLASKIFMLGYYLHDYKIMSRAFAGICMDNHVSQDGKCEGRSGKTLFANIVELMVSFLPLDGRRFNLRDGRFALAGLTDDIRVAYVDDCRHGYCYTDHFSMITGSTDVESKNVNPHTIAFNESAKWLFSTNYVPNMEDSSAFARFEKILFSDYYHMKTPTNGYLEDRKVSDDVGCTLFAPGEYQHFEEDIDFLIQCELFYLKHVGAGGGIIKSPEGNITLRQQIATVGMKYEEFFEDYFDIARLNVSLRMETILQDCRTQMHLQTLPDQSVLTKRIKAYCAMKGYIFNPASKTGNADDGERWRKTEGSNRVTYIYIATPDQPTCPTENADIKDDLPF